MENFNKATENINSLLLLLLLLRLTRPTVSVKVTLEPQIFSKISLLLPHKNSYKNERATTPL